MYNDYPREEKAISVGTSGLRTRETIAERLDRQISEVEAHLSNLKDARKLIQENPILQQFHDALGKVGF